MTAGHAHVLVVRQDNEGDVLLAGPAVRAIARTADRVTLLCGPRGRQAAALLPGVDDLVVHRAPWIDPEPPPVERTSTLAVVDRLAALEVDAAVILTSFHQSPLPTALLLRLAGVGFVAAISEDYPGALLDVRHRVEDDIHEVERGLFLAAAAGFPGQSGDDRLAVKRTGRLPQLVPDLARDPDRPVAAVHPGASVPARAWHPRHHAEVVRRLHAEGWQVVVTGGPGEVALTAAVAGGLPGVHDLGGRTSLADLAEVLAVADVVVVGNTGPAHLAAAVATPVVCLYAPTVPAARWRPWGVPHELLNAEVPCAGCRARVCPVAGHPCLERVTPADVVAAAHRLARMRAVA
jgi:ADP-heptose:LPS heptosyltransferase